LWETVTEVEQLKDAATLSSSECHADKIALALNKGRQQLDK
jgi:hypothetical protein